MLLPLALRACGASTQCYLLGKPFLCRIKTIAATVRCYTRRQSKQCCVPCYKPAGAGGLEEGRPAAKSLDPASSAAHALEGGAVASCCCRRNSIHAVPFILSWTRPSQSLGSASHGIEVEKLRFIIPRTYCRTECRRKSTRGPV